MICDRCGAYAENTSLVCDKCGSLLSRKRGKEEGVAAIRQGRVAAQQARVANENRQAEMPVYGDFDLQKPTPSAKNERLKSSRSRHNRKMRSFERDAGRPDMRRGVPSMTGSINISPVRNRVKVINPVSKHSVNWAKIWIAAVAVVMIMVVGAYFYLTGTLNGQVVMARQGKATDSQAVWIVGEEYIDRGYIDSAIKAFETARQMDLEKTPPVNNIAGLLLLGAAYEAGDRKKDAEKLYKEMYEVIVPSRPEPYRNMIRILLDRGEDKEAGELMQLAFAETAVLSFRQQRTDLLPKPPETSQPAGRYDAYQTIAFSSPQGYDVYYSDIPEAILPDEGTLYTEPITVEEGVTTYNVVCVSGRLVSDPLSITYTIYLPSPAAPKSNLQPGKYQRQQRVKLRPGPEEKKYPPDEKAKIVAFYYTLDGSEPIPEDAALYTDEGILLPTGKVTLRAIAVNGYGKISNAMSVGYEINKKPYPEPVYERTDTFSGFELMKTDQAAFEAQFGAGGEATEEIMRGFEEPCKRIAYDWGSILVGRDRQKKNWILLEVDMNKALCALPRGISFGDTAEHIMAKFRDSTQPAGASGNRGLYYSDKGRGFYYNLGDGNALVKYTCLYTDGNTLTLDFYLTNNKLTRVKHCYSYD